MKHQFPKPDMTMRLQSTQKNRSREMPKCQTPMLNAKCEMPIPNTKVQMPNGKRQMSNAKCQINAKCQTPNANNCQTPTTAKYKSQIRNAKCQIPNTKCQMPNAKCQTPTTAKYKSQIDTKCLPPSLIVLHCTVLYVPDASCSGKQVLR